ncbi:hypothetical protein P4V43_24200 [Brevibacillus fortis]|uniref:hypothetical protein n=1 Tax=Brevibacillus fortis TaxID=2126352 RepID=UPI002E23CE40|nr:hypothetical protein [Brevibacillus fortis]
MVIVCKTWPALLDACHCGYAYFAYAEKTVVRAVVVGGNRRKRSSFLGHLLDAWTARLHGKSETASKVEVQGGFSAVDA